MINNIFGVSTIICNNFPIFIPEQVINQIKTESQVLIMIKTFKHHKTGMNTEFYSITPTNSLCLKSKILCNFAIYHNLLQNYNVIIQYTLSSAVEVQKVWNLGMVIENTYKKVQRVKSTSMAHFRRPAKWYKWTFRRTYNRKNIPDQINTSTTYPSNTLTGRLTSSNKFLWSVSRGRSRST